jgi:hypothetical protein
LIWMATPSGFEPLIGEWHGEGEVPMKPPMKISVEAKIERLGKFIVMSAVGEPAEMPASVAIIGGAPDGEPQPMHYFDARGVKRLFMMALEGSTWKIWRPPARIGTAPTAPASTSGSTARSRRTARRSRAAGSAVWGTPAMSGRSTSRSTTSASAR